MNFEHLSRKIRALKKLKNFYIKGYEITLRKLIAAQLIVRAKKVETRDCSTSHGNGKANGQDNHPIRKR